TATEQTVSAAPDKRNLVARLGAGEGGVVLSGHTDTVPCDAELWTGDPYALREADGRWYGLGSADMKCFFPLVLAALDGLDAARLRRPLVLLATADEESSMAGARVLAGSGEPLGRYALIGEPTELVPIHKHKGIMVGRIEVRGRSGHSSDPSLGANALDCMHGIMSDLMRWREDAARRFVDAEFRVPGPTLNFGRIAGGDSPNRICGDCELLFDVRLMPAMTAADCAAEIEDIVRARAVAAGVEGRLVLPMVPLEAMQTAPDSALLSALGELSGNAPKTVAFATEGPFLNALGCESVIFGPGSIDTAHQPDEYVEIDKAMAMVDILRALIERFCCGD
ncbi:MAG: acetylornithine deacetylase, partial [Gammaproteobacteria bacterium]